MVSIRFLRYLGNVQNVLVERIQNPLVFVGFLKCLGNMQNGPVERMQKLLVFIRFLMYLENTETVLRKWCRDSKSQNLKFQNLIPTRGNIQNLKI